MQYVGKVGGYVYNQWNSLNPATLSGAIDVIVIEQPDGSLHCSPFHIRFGKFQIIKPLQKKIDFYVNNIKTDLPMKLGDGGEAFFVFETLDNDLVSKSVVTSPVISPASSPEVSPSLDANPSSLDLNEGLDDLDLNSSDISKRVEDDLEAKVKLTYTRPDTVSLSSSPTKSPTPTPSSLSIAFETAKKVTQKLNIPSKIDLNGDMVLDMDGYKPNSQKNIDNSDEMLKKFFIEELLKTNDDKSRDELNDFESQNDNEYDQDPKLEIGNDVENQVSLWNQIITMDKNGSIRISNINESIDDLAVDEHNNDTTSLNLQQQDLTTSLINQEGHQEKTYFKTLRLTSDQLKQMKLNYGENKLMFKLNQGNSQVHSNLFLWKSTTPIVISDIDGTITKSDALGHVLNLIGKDWTHEGVTRLFTDIHNNGYNIIYLTSRSVGQADSTRTYLKSIVQENNTKLPKGPVILSPDRTIAALKREVILRKPEVFKMSCLGDIRSLYYNNKSETDEEKELNKERTPFYAGFGNRITDAVSYRSVHIPSHRIFTINPDGEVHMELLELSGIKSSYLGIGELVDQYFPPITQLGNFNSSSFNNNNLNFVKRPEERFNDVNYWRDPINLSDLSDIEDDIEPPKSPSLLSIRSFGSDHNLSHPSANHEKLDKKDKERPKSISSFTSPLKGFFKSEPPDDSFDYGDKKLSNDKNDMDQIDGLQDDEDDDDEEDDDYDEEDEEDYEDEDYEDEDEDEEEEHDEDDEDDDYDEEVDYDDDDDYDEELNNGLDDDYDEPESNNTLPSTPSKTLNEKVEFKKASDIYR